VTQNLELQLAEDAKVRTLQPPEVFDDKGKVRKHTAEELKQLKGKNTNLIGYESSLDALSRGQVVTLTVAPHKTPKPPADKPKEAKPNPDKDPDNPDKEMKPAKKQKPGEEDNGEKKMQVKMILINTSTGGGSETTEEKTKPDKANN